MSWLDNAKAEAEARIREQKRAEIEAQRAKLQADAAEQAAELRLQQLCGPLLAVVERTADALRREGIGAYGPKRCDLPGKSAPPPPKSGWENEHEVQARYSNHDGDEWSVVVRQLKCYECRIWVSGQRGFVSVVIAVAKGGKASAYVQGARPDAWKTCSTERELQEALKPYVVEALTEIRNGTYESPRDWV